MISHAFIKTLGRFAGFKKFEQVMMKSYCPFHLERKQYVKDEEGIVNHNIVCDETCFQIFKDLYGEYSNKLCPCNWIKRTLFRDNPAIDVLLFIEREKQNYNKK